MRALILVLALVTLAPALADPPAEDEAHRLDRLETKRLNERAAPHRSVSTEHSTTLAPYGAPNRAARPDTAEEEALRRRELEAIAAWRGQVELCRRGDRNAC